MKNSLKAAIIAVPMAFVLQGCVVSIDADDYKEKYSKDWKDTEYDNRHKIARLNVGLSYNEVLDRLGDPDFNEVHKMDGSRYQVLFYRTHRKHGDGITTKDECTPVIFKNGVLDGWGEKAYQQL